VPEEQVGQKLGVFVTVRAAAKRQLVSTNHIVRNRDIVARQTLVKKIEHLLQLNKGQEA